MNENNINKVYNYLVILIFSELVLGGLGNLFGLPIRKVLFATGILFTIYIMYRDRLKLKKAYAIPMFIVIIYVGYGSIIGLINGNSFRSIFSDANSFLGVIYLILLANYFRESTKKISNAINIFVNTSIIIALITIGLFFFSRLYLPNDQSIIMKYMELNDKLQYGLITGLVQSNNYARVYLFNGIFMQIGASILMIRLLHDKNGYKFAECTKLLILLIGIFVSNTRGFWLGTIGGVILVGIYYVWKRKEWQLTIKRVVLVMAIFYVFVSLLPLTIEAPEPNQIASGTESTKDRFESMGDFKNNISNKIRVIQLEFLAEKIKEKPVLGWGFGASIEEYGQYMEENNLPSVHTSNFELYYIELLFKTGVIGIIIFFGYLIVKFVQLITLLIKYKMDKNDEIILISWTIGFITLIASGVTNPYLASLSGFFVLVMECYIVQMMIEKYDNKYV